MSAAETHKNTPEIHKHEETEIEPALQRKEEDEHMIRHRLQVPVEGMKGMGCEGRWDCGGAVEERTAQERTGHTKPLVVRLVNILVN
jgi:hypothetical protein